MATDNRDVTFSQAASIFKDELDNNSDSLRGGHAYFTKALENLQISSSYQFFTLDSGRRWRLRDGDRDFTITFDGNTTFTLDYPASDSQLSSQLATAINQLQASLNTYNQVNKTNYALKPIPAPRYWQPKDPVVLMTGNAVQPTDRYGQDGLLTCQWLNRSLNLAGLDSSTLNAIETALGEIGSSTGFRQWNEQPWNPFMLAWEVELHPHPRNNPDDATQKRWVEAYFLKQQLLPFYYVANNIPPEQQTEDYFERNWSAIYNWYNNCGDWTKCYCLIMMLLMLAVQVSNAGEGQRCQGH